MSSKGSTPRSGTPRATTPRATTPKGSPTKSRTPPKSTTPVQVFNIYSIPRFCLVNAFDTYFRLKIFVVGRGGGIIKVKSKTFYDS